MKSIFNKSDNQELINRINKLSPETQALWGKMHVGQMLGHIAKPLLIMKGDLYVNFTVIGFLMGKFLKRKYLRDRGFGKNLPTHQQFKVVDKKEFEEEKAKLIQILNYFIEKGPESITKNKHPFFGYMKHDEWDDMMYLHINHHLNQFGV